VWRLIDENGAEHKHRYPRALDAQQPQYDQQFTNNNNNVVNTGNTNRPFFRRRRIVDIETVADIEEARKLLSSMKQTHENKIAKVVWAIYYLMMAIMVSVLLQLLFFSEYYTGLLSIAPTISYGLAAFIMGSTCLPFFLMVYKKQISRSIAIRFGDCFSIHLCSIDGCHFLY
jgi:hypothetical protein